MVSEVDDKKNLLLTDDDLDYHNKSQGNLDDIKEEEMDLFIN